MNRLYSLLTLFAGGIFWVTTAQGAVVTTGDAIYIAPPPSVERGVFSSNTNFFVFEETTQTLTSDLDVDWLASNGGALSNGGGGTIAAGTGITSYFVHFSPETLVSGGVEVSGDLTFSQKIIAVIFSWQNLATSDSVLGAPGTSYPTGNKGRKYESWDQNHSYLVDDYTLHINTKAWAPLMDQARVITAPVPVPAALWLFVSGILAMIGLNRRRKRAAASIAR